MNVKRLNGVFPPLGTIIRGLDEAWVVRLTDGRGAELTVATTKDYYNANVRNPAEVHSVYEHHLIPPRPSVFGPIRMMG